MMTEEAARRHVAGILAHPSFSAFRPDVVLTPGPDGAIRISGPKNALDAFVPALLRCGVETLRTAPATLLVTVL